ncbi:MAG TPA: 5-deoxy-glucuronate isomerase [bacterium]|nr:5-deoxy-glucuronate isomerase [Candidatus Omnitrophota bacterium]HOJ60638.1 5-deoxy-glucuronate isomerase [bacterium]HOL96042.1 5-deoxy-glucuronate isomerase [bacterium]HPP02916.1 5-deoxy-glucuronate isomerase [bacterium]HXK95555.1 5-deoxy-glucuronate isomerase [bacterium]
MTRDLIRHPYVPPLRAGWNPLVEDDPEVQMVLGIQCLGGEESVPFYSTSEETALLLLEGRGTVEIEGRLIPYQRDSWIEENPLAVHAPRGVPVAVHAETASEFAVIRTPNPEAFDPRVYLPADIGIDHRGKGILDDACYRIVRTVFDRSNAPEAARLVLGEVVNFPGRWSSYPPHHHPQPELYYYRFAPEWGYGHGEVGEAVYKLRQHDVTRITDNRDHSQTAAPGIYMYYLWTIRHLPGHPYTGWEYTKPFETLLG